MAAPSLAVTGRKDGYLMIDYFEQIESQVKDADGQQTELLTPIDASIWLDTEPPAPDQILEDICDLGDKLAIIAPSKMRKSFFLLMLILCLATGRDFLGWHVPKRRRVLLVQMEIQPNHYHRRLNKMACAMGIIPADLGDRLQILNARGMGIRGADGIQKITEIAKQHTSEVICIDPLYKIADGAENAMEDGKVILDAFDKMARNVEATIVYVHHDTKGNQSDKAIQDRGAGSNILGRDYDACITLTPHASETDAAIVDTLLRNYRPQQPFVILWTEDAETGGYRFELRSEIAPTKKSSAKNCRDAPPVESYLPVALELLKHGPVPIALFMDRFRSKSGITHQKSKAFKDWALNGQDPALATDSKRRRGLNEKVIGTPEQILRLRGQHE